jgi:GT2 family glycosyltransferase
VAGGMADHLYIGQNFKQLIRTLEYPPHEMADIRHDMTVSAVTAAAVMIKKTKFDKIGGMNEVFIIGGGDIDLCLRLKEIGYRSVLMGSANGYMIHKESKSRSMLAIPYVDFVESYKSYIKHFDIAQGDPFMSQEVVKHGK